jgi:chemotaxis protein methyltransferase CheR
MFVMIGDTEFTFIQGFLMQRTGILLNAEKRYLVETRLDPVMRQLQLASFRVVVDKLKMGDRTLETAVIDAMTTNETLFFRDKMPFDLFQNQVMPELIRNRRADGRIRIWCAACSTGQEPYSLSMILDEMKPRLNGITVEILATDVSEKVIAQAREGVYSQFEVQRGLPIRYLLKHFTQVGSRWQIDKALADRIQFKTLNLLHGFKALGQFDIIFCRNVLIYFGEPTKRDILNRMSEVLASDGSLILGGAETVLGLTSSLAPHKTERSLYVQASSPNAYPTYNHRPRQAG